MKIINILIISVLILTSCSTAKNNRRYNKKRVSGVFTPKEYKYKKGKLPKDSANILNNPKEKKEYNKFFYGSIGFSNGLMLESFGCGDEIKETKFRYVPAVYISFPTIMFKNDIGIYFAGEISLRRGATMNINCNIPDCGGIVNGSYNYTVDAIFGLKIKKFNTEYGIVFYPATLYNYKSRMYYGYSLGLGSDFNKLPLKWWWRIRAGRSIVGTVISSIGIAYNFPLSRKFIQ